MIPVHRGAEPQNLEAVRAAKLAAYRLLGRAPRADEIDGYRGVAVDLWRAQHFKCCYCEHKITSRFNDVEHYRPKGRAVRVPGCTHDHGYWWLAFTWDNLLFACPSCNRSGKNDLFPLDHGSVSLQPEHAAPGGEIPLLIDPGSSVNPVEHIKFVKETLGPSGGPFYWWARARNQSVRGQATIDACDLNHLDLLELRNDHFESVILRYVTPLRDALANNSSPAEVEKEFVRALYLLDSRNCFVGFTYDALCACIPNSELAVVAQLSWPKPDQLGL